MPTVRDVLFDLMRELKMTKIFGNIGSTEETMLMNFPSDFQYVLALQESVAVAMADGYSQATGEPVHVNLHTAAGSGNAMGNIETAWYNRTPMIVTAGQQTREMLLLEPYLANKNPLLQAAPWVKWSYEPVRAEDVPAAFLRAYAMAVQAPAGPVYLSLPMDDMDKECPMPPAKRVIERRLSAGKDILGTVAEALASASTPALILGGAVDQSDGWEDAVRLAEKLQCPVWAPAFEGRPGFPETHPLYRGILASGIGPLSDQLKGHDLVLVIGAPVFRYYPNAAGDYLPKGTHLIHLTDSSEEAARAPVGDSYLVDPGRACATLAELVPQTKRIAATPLEPDPAPQVGSIITPDFLYYTLAKLRPKDSIITHESLSSLPQLKKRLPTKSPRSFFSMFSGVLGYGLPAAVGVALAERDKGGSRKVIALQGDGATQYVIQAFWNAAQEKLPILFIVVRNEEYCILKSFAAYLETPGVPALDLPGIDTVMLAKGYGCEGAHVTKPEELEEAIELGLAHPGPYVLEVHTDKSVPPLLGENGPATEAASKQ
jgi:benzoylformate decarboxylase